MRQCQVECFLIILYIEDFIHYRGRIVNSVGCGVTDRCCQGTTILHLINRSYGDVVLSIYKKKTSLSMKDISTDPFQGPLLL